MKFLNTDLKSLVDIAYLDPLAIHLLVCFLDVFIGQIIITAIVKSGIIKFNYCCRRCSGGVAIVPHVTAGVAIVFVIVTVESVTMLKPT
ncbi:hypothetical protein TIFTF001_034559 [Ficus carica]|uniref:Uncharacterized protein n=1 Tax=Ficus carica TaxID=3494 RepID=A0AA88DZZ7_FICCA|nr:hypothetical protein TIFTF001_034538 [Ficus carica]GMN65479.1 hypothetical protein TIFTF001_034559 [Ficus carica]